jgi:hypothetical protein
MAFVYLDGLYLKLQGEGVIREVVYGALHDAFLSGGSWATGSCRRRSAWGGSRVLGELWQR